MDAKGSRKRKREEDADSNDDRSKRIDTARAVRSSHAVGDLVTALSRCFENDGDHGTKWQVNKSGAAIQSDPVITADTMSALESSFSRSVNISREVNSEKPSASLAESSSFSNNANDQEKEMSLEFEGTREVPVSSSDEYSDSNYSDSDNEDSAKHTDIDALIRRIQGRLDPSEDSTSPTLNSQEDNGSWADDEMDNGEGTRVLSASEGHDDDGRSDDKEEDDESDLEPDEAWDNFMPDVYIPPPGPAPGLLSKPYRSRNCGWNCNNPRIPVFMCRGCERVGYCNTECQDSDWNWHHHQCTRPRTSELHKVLTM